MKKVQSRGLSVLLAAVMAAGCIGCAAKETGNEEEGQSQGNVHQDTQTGASDDAQGGESGAADNSSAGYGEYPEPVLFDGNCVFEYEIWNKEDTQIQSPGGILYDGEDLLVCDMGNHCIVRLTADGGFVEKYGELGSETGNFVTPTAILLHENEIYVLDSGNMRIQVFDTDMNYVREILFEAGTLSNGGKYSDMAIAGDGTVYIAADASFKEESGLFYIEEGALYRVPINFRGYLAEWNGVVYAADKWQFYTSGGSYGSKPGENWLYQVEKTGGQKICELPYMYAPADFVVKDDAMYTISTVWGQMNRVSMEGELLEELLTDKDAQAAEMYLCMMDEDTFYLAVPGGALWKVFRTESLLGEGEK